MYKFKLDKFLVTISLLSGSLSCLAMLTEKNQTQKEFKQEQELKNKYLMKSITLANIVGIKQAIENGACINFVNEYYDTPLIKAARIYDYDIVKLLIDLKADVNQKVYETALYVAASANSHSIIKLLIDSGADVNVQCEVGEITPLSNYLYNSLTQEIDLDTVKFFLNAGTDISLKNLNTKETALDFTKRLKHLSDMSEILKLLIEWQEKTEQIIRTEVGKYLIPDIANIVCEYAVGPREEK